MASCDLCGTSFETSEGWMAHMHKETIQESVVDSEWYLNVDTCYCDKCHEVDDNDNVVLLVNAPHVLEAIKKRKK